MIDAENHTFITYQYALSDSISESALLLLEIYSFIFSRPLNVPSIAKSEGALVVGSSPQQLSSNFWIAYSTYSIPDSFKRLIALREASDSSTSRTGLRLDTRFFSCVGR
jgi:hypothetical protein